jgi:hypothetical protein
MIPLSVGSMTINNTGADYAPAFTPIAVVAAVAFGIWAFVTDWRGITITVLQQPASLSPGFISLAAVTLAACLLMRAPLRTTLATAGLFGGFGFLWLIAQAAPLALR